MRKIYFLLLTLFIASITNAQNVTVSGANAGNGSYATLSAAFTAINGGVQTGATISITIDNNTSEPAGGAILNAGAWTSLSIQPAGGGARVVTGAATAGLPLIDFNGADNVTVDGLNTGGNSLTISNTTASATSGTSTIRFIGGATNNMIIRATIEGSFSATVATNGGNIYFATDAVTTSGNDNNTISTCNIGPAGANLPTKGIYGNGTTTTTGHYNSGIIISGNNIHDYFGAAVASAGVYVGGGNTDWMIINNRFYQSATRTQTTGTIHAGVQIASSNVNNCSISGNTIGYSSSAGTGTYTFVGVSSSSRFYPIYLSTHGTTTATSIQGNIITAIAVSGAISGTSTSSPFTGILVSSGLANLGTTTGNTIGSTGAAGAITFTSSSTSTSDVYGIYFFPSQVVTISNNSVGGITLSNSSTGAIVFQGLRAFTTSSVVNTFQNNTVGYATAPITVTATSSSSMTVGIKSESGVSIVTGNTVRHLSMTGANTGTGNSSSMIGIWSTNTGATIGNLISENTIHSLSNTAAAAVTVTGIVNNGSTTGTHIIARNFIHSLSASSATAILNGMVNVAGTTTFQNNMVRLGINDAGASITSGLAINGVLESTGTNNYYFNTIYIGGSGVVSSLNTFAFNSTVTTSVRSFRNNIFFNARSNGSGAGVNYAVQVGGTTPNPAGLTINNNIYFVSGTGGVLGRFNGADVATLAAWQAAVGQDQGSVFADPQLANPIAATPDLHLHPTNPTPAEGAGFDVGVTDDFDGQLRAGLTPVDIGADAGNFVVLDLAPPSIIYTPFTYTCSGAARILVATITDGSGVPVAGAGLPVLYWRINAGAYTAVTGTSLGGNQYQFSFGAGAVIGDVVSYYIVAQDNATVPNVAVEPFTGAGGMTANPPSAATPPATPSSYPISNILNGTYNVGAGQTYTSLTAAVNAYNTSCIGGPVVFNLVDATYPSETFPISILANEYASATNTLTIRPASGTAVTVSGTSGATASGLIRLNGAKYVIIDGINSGGASLTVENTSTTAGTTVFWISSNGAGMGATNNTIRNTNIRAGVTQNTSTTNTYGIIIAGNTLSGTHTTINAGEDNDNNTIQGNTFTKVRYGIYIRGGSAANPNTGTVVSNNIIGPAAFGADEIGKGGITVREEDGIVISGNEIRFVGGDLNNTSSGADRSGITFGTDASWVPTSVMVKNALVTNNRIHDIVDEETFSASAIAIGVADGLNPTNNLFANNMIYNIKANGTSPDQTLGIGLTAGNGDRVVHNTIYLTGDTDPTVGSTTPTISNFGIIINTTSVTNPIIADNIIFMDLTSSSAPALKNAAISIPASFNWGTGYSNYNDLYIVPANAQSNIGAVGGSGGTFHVTLAAWQVAVSQDANSINVVPVFVSPTDLHLVPASNTALNNLGQPIAGVTTDIDGDLRSLGAPPQGPDMGADEFLGLCTGAEGGTAAGGASYCVPSTPTITATGYSEGTDATYQWQSSTDNFVSNIVDIPGQTNPATLTTGVVSTTTYYRLRVTCPTGTALDYSNTVVVEVNSSPIISTDPGSTAVCAGATASFSVALSNPGPFTYQWQENTGSGFNNIPGATASTLAFTAITTQNGYQYRVLVTNTCGTTTSGAATLTVSANPVATIAYGQRLYASDNAGNLYVINTTSGAGTLVGNFDGTTIGSTEIEFNHNTGKAYAQGSGSNSLYEFNINTGAYIGPVVNTGAVHAGLEFVNNTLYGTSFIAPLGPASFTVLNPVTGVSTPVGPTGTGTIAGLAYDLTSGIMYGIAGGGGPAGLYTINMSTGAATLIGSTGIQAGSLEFGPDGRLYAGGTGATNAGNIYTINTTTGAATLLGATGTTNGITGLALANVPAVFCSNEGTVPVILTGSTGGTFTSSPAGLSIDAGTGAVNTNTSTTGNYTVTYTIPAVGTCPQVIASAPITINTAPVVAPITGPSTVCTGQTITLSSATPGGTWTSTNTSAATVDPNTGVVTGVAAGSTTINYSVVAGCTTVVSAGVSVLAGPPTPVISPAAPVICAGTVQPLSISSGASTVTFTGGAITLPAGAPGTTSGPASPYPSVIAVSGLPTAGVTVKSVTINGLTHTFPGDLDILLQSPTTTNVVLMSDVGGGVDATGQNYTFDDAAAGLMSFTALNPTGSYRPSNNGTPDTWVAPGPGAITQANPALSMFTGNFNGNWNLFAVDDAGGDVGSITSWSITFDVSPIIWSPLTGLFTDAAGTIPYTGTSTSTVYASPATTTTYTASTSSGGCTASGTVTVTVNPVPNVNAVSNQAVCHGSSVAAINFTGTVPGTVYSWTNSAPSIGLAASGTGDIASFTGTNTGTTPVVATITVTPTYTNAGTTCTGTVRTFTITVNPILAITTQPVNTVVCAGVNTSFSVAVSGAPTYQWQINQGSGFTNLTNTAPFSGVNTNTLAITAPTTSLSGSQFQVVITSPCGNATSSIASLTVNPLPTISVGPSGQCAPVVLTATGTSNTYSWSPATGLNTTTGPTVTASPTGNTVYTVTGTITATGCQNSATATVLGTPPAVVVTPANPSICAGAIQQLTVPSGTGTYTSSGTITIPFGAPTTTSGPALPYPSTISVSGLPTSGVTVRSVTINGVTHTFPGDLDILLQSPTSTNVVLMSDVGGGVDATGQNYTFEDGAATLMSTTALNPSGTYRPTNGGATDTWVAPGPGSITQATPLLSSFSGNPNGNWGLYIVDDAGGDAGSITNWSITFNLPTATWSPATGLFTDPNATIPYVAGTVLNTVYASPTSTTTYTVTGVLGTCSVPSGTVTVTVNPRPTISVTPNNQCGPVTLTASGTSNTYSWSPAAGLSATTGATVTANPTVNTVYTVTGTITNTGCTNTASVTVNATPPAPVVTPTSVTICSGAIATLTAASGNGTATVTSGTISVAIPDNNPAGANHTLAMNSVPAGATITDVSVNFNVTHTFDGDLIINLRAPNNNVLNLVNRRGGAGDNFVNTTISSTASSPISGGTAPFTGTYTADGANAVGPTGYVSNVTAFSGLTSIPNGNWTLAISDNAGADIGTLTSWTVNITYTLPNAIWTPVTGLFTNPTATIPYVAGTPLNTVYARPTTTTTYSVTRTTGTCASPAATVTVTVISPISITTQPASVTTCAGANATFSVVATGNLLTYQWQISTDGGTTWNPIAGATGASLVVPSVTTTMTNNRYRVVITNSCNTVTSSAATLTVNALTPPTVTPLTNRICLSDTLIPLVGLPAGGTWTGVGVSGNNFVPSATAVGTYTLTYTYRNAQNCTASATVVAKVEDCPERLIRLTDNAVILYPNPNNGLFNIRINSTLYNYLGMRVYNVQGQLLRIQNFNGLVYGRVIPVDLRHLPGGTYMVKFYYDDGVRTSDKTFKVVIAR